MKGTTFLLITLILLTCVWSSDSLPQRYSSATPPSRTYRHYKIPKRLDAPQFQFPPHRGWVNNTTVFNPHTDQVKKLKSGNFFGIIL